MQNQLRSLIKHLLRVLVGLLPLAACAEPEAGMTVTSGGWADIDNHVTRLTQANDYAILVIEVEGSEAFIQFSGAAAGIQLDFPLVTDAQQARESSIREFLEQRELPAVINRGTHGSRFLDTNLPADPDLVSRIAREALREIFGVGESARFQFSGQGLAPAP